MTALYQYCEKCKRERSFKVSPASCSCTTCSATVKIKVETGTLGKKEEQKAMEKEFKRRYPTTPDECFPGPKENSLIDAELCTYGTGTRTMGWVDEQMAKATAEFTKQKQAAFDTVGMVLEFNVVQYKGMEILILNG